MSVSQSAVSQHLAKLEAAVGTPLMLRERGGLRLTRAGRDLFDPAERHATLRRLIDERVEAHAMLGRGHLTVIANAPRPAPIYLAAFWRQHPGVEVAFTLYDWTTAMRLIRERRVDVAVVTEPHGVGDALVRRVGGARYRAWTPADHPLAASAPVSLTDLAAEAVILPEEGSYTQIVVRAALAEHGLALGRVIEATTAPVMKEAVLHGVGVFLEDSMRPSAGLATVAIDELARATCVVVPADKEGLATVRGFLDVAA